MNEEVSDLELQRWAVIAVAHPALRGVRPFHCADCLKLTRSAVITANVTGSIGATYERDEHSCTVRRALVVWEDTP